MNRLFALNRFWLLLTSLLLNATAVEAQQFPYTAYVNGGQAYVRSGPGQRYYPTGQIPEGFAVEVYRHDGAGWCAIRPPEGSYSWVSSHQVRAINTHLAEIVAEHVVTRVGSTLSLNRSAVQVLLPKGEQVELLPATENDDPRWVRIAAPAGEFRWIAADALSRQPPMEAEPLPHPDASGWSRQSKHARATDEGESNAFGHLSRTTVKVQPRSSYNAPTTNAPTTIPSSEPAAVVSSDPNTMDVVAGSPAELQLAQFQGAPAGVAPPALLNSSEAASIPTVSSQPRVRFRGLSSTTPISVGSVEELELRLSQTVVQPPQQWELDSLENAANSLLTNTKTPSVRAQLREVLDRITRFQQVQQRYKNPAPTVVPERDPFVETTTTSEAAGLTGMSSRVRERAQKDLTRASNTPSSTAAATVEKPLYDATGLLKPVISKRAEAPQYALVDERGKVVSFVTPTPDLNLKPYIGRRIGVHGTRGFLPEYRRAHVTAGRVTPIDGTVRR